MMLQRALERICISSLSRSMQSAKLRMAERESASVTAPSFTRAEFRDCLLFAREEFG